MSKTEQIYYNKYSDESIKNLNGKKKKIDYLGFSYNGKSIYIREKSLFKYYCRAYRKAKHYNKSRGTIKEHAIKKSLFRLYTHLGDKKHSDKRYGNFLTYARRSHEIFSESIYFDSKIKNQVKRHWEKINKKMYE